ncbi:uncharacterized protein LOC125509208 [Triticum urartu]|uniref:uncharacterized protein LOC125509208 n=1 Tax=Triticum urartu TaxID=4572 RepID=UPI00204489C4|nr:uncharacterized protein LOC125509208 [Triticum urartu]XP_048530078.1 uncharacterized protein LOC125509208 [Triticum urartu]
MGGVWEDRLGRIERHLEKTYTRVPPRSSRTSSTLPDNRFLYKFEARTQKRKGKEMKGARLLEAKTGGRGRSSMVASMGVEECVKTLQSTVEELVSRTSCSRCCMATQPDLPRQVRALRHRPRAHLAGCWEGGQCEQDGQGQMESKDPNSGPEANLARSGSSWTTTRTSAAASPPLQWRAIHDMCGSNGTGGARCRH